MLVPRLVRRRSCPSHWDFSLPVSSYGCLSGPDQDLVSRLTEADMVLADLERANSRVAVVEGRNVCSFILLSQQNN